MGVGLHVHSEGSFLDGLSSVQQIVNRAVLLGHNAVAVTDHGECNQHFELQKRATKAGIKPIFGMEGYFVDSIDRVKKEKDRLNSHIVFWAENNEGLKNLWSISSLAYLNGFYYRPLADFEMLREYSKGLMVSDSCMLTDLSRAIIRDDEETVRRNIGTLLSIYGENNYFMELHTWQFTDEDTFLEEIRRANTVIEDPRVDSLTLAEARKTKKDYEGLIKLNRDMTKINQVKAQLAKEMGIPLVVVNDAHYAEPDQWENHALVWQMSTNDDQVRGGRTAAWQMSDEEMVEWMAKHGISRSVTEEALRNTEWIGDRCDAEIKTKLHLPTVSGDMDKDLEIYKKGIEEGFKKKVEGKFPPEVVQEYRERSDYENETIIPRNFHGYFNVVADYVKFAKGRGEGTPWEGKKESWLVGPARGSGGGSLNAWLLDITEINPMSYELMFERFLNPARKGFPDFDVDFPQSKRDEMKEYVSWKYGAERVTAIGTFSRLQPRGLLRDLGRAMEIPYEDINTMAGIIEQVKDIDTANVEVSWDEVLQEAGGELAPWAEKYPVVFEKLGEMMGMVRQSGTHAAGMIISDETLLGSIPIRKKGEMITSQFEMYTVEDMGFVKFDFLGIRHLDTLMDADAMVHGEHDPRRYYDMTKSQMAEPEIWKDVHEGKTLGIFQVECLHEDTLVEGKSLKQWWSEGGPKELWSLDESSKTFVRNKVAHMYDCGVKDIYEVECEDGRVVRCGPEHPFLTQNRGWVQAQNLNEKDRVYKIPGQVPGSRYSEESRVRAREATLKWRQEHPERLPEIDSRLKNYQEEFGNGRLGKKASDETRERYRQDQIARWRDPEYRESQLAKIGSATQSEVYRESCRGREPRGSGFGKAGVREDLGHNCRSTWEANVARILKYRGVEYEYEPDRFKFTLPNGTTSGYTPDFKLQDGTYIEVKGWWWPGYYERFQAFLREYPEVPVQVIGPDEYRELANQYSEIVLGWEK